MFSQSVIPDTVFPAQVLWPTLPTLHTSCALFLIQVAKASLSLDLVHLQRSGFSE